MPYLNAEEQAVALGHAAFGLLLLLLVVLLWTWWQPPPRGGAS